MSRPDIVTYIHGNARGLLDALARVRGDARRTAGETQSVFSNMSRRVDRDFAGLATRFAGFLAPIALAHQSLSTISDASNLVKAAERVGLTTDEFQGLQHGMRKAGIEASEFEQGMERFTRGLGEAAAGGGRLKEILEANGIALRDGDGNMRSTMALLRDYAELVRNAGNEQDRLLLVTTAFGDRRTGFVNALMGGASALDDMGEAARRTGNIIDAELLKKAEEIDDEFADLWRYFEIRGKEAILSVAVTLREGLLQDIKDTGDALRDMMADPSWRNFSRLMLGDGRTGSMFGKDADQRIREAHGGRATPVDPALERLLRERYGYAEEITNMPSRDGDGGAAKRDAATRALEREIKAVEDLIERLEHEISIIGLSDVEKAKANALRQAGAVATDEQRSEIERLVEILHEETDAVERSQKAHEERQKAIENGLNMIGNGLADIFSRSEDAGEAVKRLAIQLAFAVAQAALLGSGPLSGLFGGGLFGKGGFKWPGLANGTNNWEGGVAMVGERGRELVNLPRGSQVIPSHLLGGAGGGGHSIVELRLSPDVEARILQEAENQAVQISRESVGDFSANALPARMQDIQRHPRKRGG